SASKRWATGEPVSSKWRGGGGGGRGPAPRAGGFGAAQPGLEGVLRVAREGGGPPGLPAGDGAAVRAGRRCVGAGSGARAWAAAALPAWAAEVRTGKRAPARPRRRASPEVAP